MTKFERYGVWLGSTWAHRRFRIHETEINQLYWSFAPAAGYTDYLARHAPQPATTQGLFHATGPDAQRVANTTAEWRSHFREFQNWVRLAALLSASSYLETYVRSAVMLAIKSDPLARFGRPRLMDGVTWLKHGMRDDLEPLVRLCVEGTWEQRAARYRDIFGSIPKIVEDNIPELNRMRSLRNSVGHSFGRNLHQHGADLISLHPGTAERLSEARFKKWLGMISEVAYAIEHHLAPTHIGEFETLAFYGDWRTKPRPAQDRRFTEARAFSTATGRMAGRPCGVEFSKGLIAYYRTV